MKLHVVSNFNLVNNKATSWFQAQTSQQWNYKLIPIWNNQKWNYMLFSISNVFGIRLQLVSNFNLVNNEAKSCFRAQTSQEWKYKLIRISNNQKWSYKLFNLVNNEAKNCFRAQTSQEWNYKLIPISNNRKWSYK